MRVGDAIRLFESAERSGHDPDLCSAARWTCYMLRGDLELAWRESAAITQRGRPDPHRFWDGRPFTGRRVLVRCLHGLGDTIQFIRYAPHIREQARFLAIEAQPTLKLLLEEARIADQVFTWGEPEPLWDQQVEVVELPRIFRTTLASIPNRVPYLFVPDTPAIPVEGRSGPLRAGLVWASSSYNPARSVPIERLASLFSVSGVQFFSLQAGPERAQLEPWSSHVLNLHEESACVLATAKTLMGLDLVITVDTMMAHLAGALARPVWTMLPHESDWRWMLDRKDSPWYPSMRLFRQSAPGDWDPVVDRVRVELETLVAARGHFPCPARLHSAVPQTPAPEA